MLVFVNDITAVLEPDRRLYATAQTLALGIDTSSLWCTKITLLHYLPVTHYPIEYRDPQLAQATAHMNTRSKPATVNPFELTNELGYQAWRERKLDRYLRTVNELPTPILNPFNISHLERDSLIRRCRDTNMAIYQLKTEMTGEDPTDKRFMRVLGTQLGLQRLDDNLCADNDSITSLQVMQGGRHEGYIPYSNKRLNWHTDGYYNEDDQCIRAFLIHCVRNASQGGENSLLDHEMAYLLMRDENPAWVEAFMRPDAMTIPANIENGVEIRPTKHGPVFSLDSVTGSLHMRYTARTRNIIWKQERDTQAAVAFMRELLSDTSPYIVTHRLQPGQGLICNNVLHSRSAFTDIDGPDQQRLLYRARYYDRIVGTGLNEVAQAHEEH